MSKTKLLLLYLTFNSFIFSINDNHDLFKGKKILITGGTGYLGKALTKEILKYNPEKIIIFSRDEVKHFNFEQYFNNNNIENVIGDIRDYNSLLNATQDIDIVIHAAALKRIDIIEDNVTESIKTNIIGSLNLFNACVSNNIKKVIFVSTDKACLPINTYGACKFISEKIFTNYDKAKIKTVFSVVRYGNVLESTGSILPIFLEKLKQDEEIPLTDPKMTRFIIDKNQAVETIFDAIRFGTGGEIFVKKLPSTKIVDLIEILKNKLKSNSKIKIVGIRPGEKLHETLINEHEIQRTFEYKNYYIVLPTSKNWIKNNKNQIYIKEGKLTDKISEYNSFNSLANKETIENLLNISVTIKRKILKFIK